MVERRLVMRRIFLVGVAVMCIAGVLGFASMSVAADTIKLAAMEPLSGNFKDIGERYLSGVEYAVKEINAGGGLLGQKVELIAVDTELKPDVATRKATKLIMQDDVKFFCGGTGSSVGGAMSVLAEKNNAIMISYGMAAASLTGPKCSKNFFRTCLTTDQQSYALAAWVAKNGYKKVATIAQDYSFGHEATAAFIKRVKALNPQIEITVELYHKIGEKDYAPYISQIISSKPEIVFTSNWGNDLTLLIKQAESLGMKSKFACYYLNDEYVISAVGSEQAVLDSVTAECYMLSIPTEKNAKFVEGFYKANGHYPTYLRGKAYSSIMFWAEAVKKAGSTKVEDVIKAWEGLKWDGLAGAWEMRACDHQAQIPAWIGKIVKDNKYFKHPFVGQATIIPAGDIATPCEETGCTRIK